MKKIFILAILALFICSCNKKILVDNKPLNLQKAKNYKKILILPFYSCSKLNTPILWEKINLSIYNEISDNFISHGFFPVPFDEIENFLIKNNYIKLSNKTTNSPYLIRELNNPEWSLTMKKEIYKILVEKKEYNNDKNFISKYRNIVNEDTIYKLGKKFNAQYIIKGIITNFSIGNVETLNPFKIGFFNSPVRFVRKALFGDSNSTNWDKGLDIFAGGILAGAIGSLTSEPLSGSHQKTVTIGHPLYGIQTTEEYGGNKNYHLGNALIWGATGAFATFLSSHGGFLPKVNFGLRIFIYNVKDKEMIWTNRINLHVEPESVWATQNINELISYAIQNSINKLFKGFWSNNFITARGD